MLALLEDVDMPVAMKTVAASLAAGLFRIVLMPVDACKTIMQVGADAAAVDGVGLSGGEAVAGVSGSGCAWRNRR